MNLKLTMTTVVVATLAIAGCQSTPVERMPITRTTTAGNVTQVDRYAHMTDSEAWAVQQQACYSSLAEQAKAAADHEKEMMSVRSALLGGMVNDSMRLAALSMINSQDNAAIMGKIAVAFATADKPGECSAMGPFQYREARAKVWGGVFHDVLGVAPWYFGYKAFNAAAQRMGNGTTINGSSNTVDQMHTEGANSGINRSYVEQTAPYGGVPLTPGDPNAIISNPNAIPADPNVIPVDPNLPTTTPEP